MLNRLHTHGPVRAVLLGIALAACSGDASTPVSPVPPVPAPVATVSLDAGTTSLVQGQSVTITAELRAANGTLLRDRRIDWTSETPSLATVTPGGVVTAVAAGRARITATAEGRAATIGLEILAPETLVHSLDVDRSRRSLEEGARLTLTAVARDAAGQVVPGAVVRWSVTDAQQSVTVTTDGVVVARRMGHAVVTAQAGSAIAQVPVTVLGTSEFDLLLDRWAANAGNVMRPMLTRLDLRDPDGYLTHLTPFEGLSDATVSADGERVAFVCTEAHGPALCRARVDGSEIGLVRIAGFPDLRVADPVWSPDGTRIAFTGWAPGGPAGLFNPSDIWVVQADGTNPVRITRGERNVRSYASPTWSPRQPDGTYRLAFVRESRSSEGYQVAHIESAREDGSDLRPMTAEGLHADGAPAWSPDGRDIAFVRTGGSANGDLWLVNVASGAERPLMAAAVEPDGAQRTPAWSPDGQRLAFTSNHEIIGSYFAWQVYTVQRDGSDLRRLTDDRAEKSNPVWLRRR